MNLTLRGVLSLLWRQRSVLQLSVIAAVLLAVVYMHIASRSYTISLQLVPAPSSAASGRSLGSLGALAGSVGLGNVDGSGQSFKIYLAGLQSRAAAEVLAKNKGLLKRMYPDGWSEEDNTWKESHGVFHQIGVVAKAVLGLPQKSWHSPSTDEIYSFLQDNIAIQEARDTPVVTVTIRSGDRQLASDILLALTQAVDGMMRDRALNRANEYIRYLSKELDLVQVSDYRASLIERLSEQEKQKMMASANRVSYVVDVFSGPNVSPVPTSPKLMTSFIGSLVFCFFLACLLAAYLDFKEIVFEFSWRTLLQDIAQRRLQVFRSTDKIDPRSSED